MAKRKKSRQSPSPTEHDPFTVLYPNLSAWVQDGWVEIGRDHYSESFVRALDAGGMIWEGKTRYGTIHQALQALDAGIAEWLSENR